MGLYKSKTTTDEQRRWAQIQHLDLQFAHTHLRIGEE